MFQVTINQLLVGLTNMCMHTCTVYIAMFTHTCTSWASSSWKEFLYYCKFTGFFLAWSLSWCVNCIHGLCTSFFPIQLSCLQTLLLLRWVLVQQSLWVAVSIFIGRLSVFTHRTGWHWHVYNNKCRFSHSNQPWRHPLLPLPLPSLPSFHHSLPSQSPESINWHHAGAEKAILCASCRLHYRKYGTMKPITGQLTTSLQYSSHYRTYNNITHTASSNLPFPPPDKKDPPDFMFKDYHEASVLIVYCMIA